MITDIKRFKWKDEKIPLMAIVTIYGESSIFVIIELSTIDAI